MKKRSNQGITTIELVVAIFLLMLIIPTCTTLYPWLTKGYANGLAQAEVQHSVTQILHRATKEMQHATSVEILSDPIPESIADNWCYLGLQQRVESGSSTAQVLCADQFGREWIPKSGSSAMHCHLSFSRQPAGRSVQITVSSIQNGCTFTAAAEVPILNMPLNETVQGLSGTTVRYLRSAIH